MEQLTNFSKSLQSYGHFNVTYTSPKTGKSWTTLTTDAQLIDSTFNSDNPTQADLNRLKKLCKRKANVYN